MIGLYSPGTSVIHRLPVIVKLVGLSGLLILIGVLDTPWFLFGAAALVVVGILVARVPLPTALRQILPVLWILVLAVPLQIIFTGWLPALMMGGKLVASVACAALFTMTTQVSALLDATRTLLWPLRRWVNADRIGLLLALTIRCIPVIADIVREVLEARRARGVERSVRALVVPVVVRSLQTAEELGEALIARGADD